MNGKRALFGTMALAILLSFILPNANAFTPWNGATMCANNLVTGDTCYGSMSITSPTYLTSDLNMSGNLTLYSTLYTNGYSIAIGSVLTFNSACAGSGSTPTYNAPLFGNSVGAGSLAYNSYYFGTANNALTLNGIGAYNGIPYNNNGVQTSTANFIYNRTTLKVSLPSKAVVNGQGSCPKPYDIILFDSNTVSPYMGTYNAVAFCLVKNIYNEEEFEEEFVDVVNNAIKTSPGPYTFYSTNLGSVTESAYTGYFVNVGGNTEFGVSQTGYGGSGNDSAAQNVSAGYNVSAGHGIQANSDISTQSNFKSQGQEGINDQSDYYMCDDLVGGVCYDWCQVQIYGGLQTGCL